MKNNTKNTSSNLFS